MTRKIDLNSGAGTCEPAGSPTRTHSTVRSALKVSNGNTMALPWLNDARNPRMSTEQWNNGGEHKMTSAGVHFIAALTWWFVMFLVVQDNEKLADALLRAISVFK